MCIWKNLKVLETLPLDRRFAQVARKGRLSSLASGSAGQTVSISSRPSACLPELHPNISFSSASHCPGRGTPEGTGQPVCSMHSLRTSEHSVARAQMRLQLQ